MTLGNVKESNGIETGVYLCAPEYFQGIYNIYLCALECFRETYIKSIFVPQNTSETNIYTIYL